MNYQIVNLQDRYDLFEKSDEINMAAWDDFMLHCPVANECWMPFIETFKDYQLIIMEDDEILATLNTVPIHYDGDIKDLPDQGWEWAVQKALSDFKEKKTPNMIVGLQVVVNKAHQGKGLSSIAVKEMANLGRQKGFTQLIIPVRPSNKHEYPLIPMEDYMEWKNDEGYPFDAWLRVHVKAGAELIKACHKAVVIPASIKEWTEWTGQKFPGSGDHIVKGALSPVHFNVEKDKGIYEEPNVWTLHTLA